MFDVERDAQNPATMWWATATLTTVGCGDVYPITPGGKFLASMVAIIAYQILLLPVNHTQTVVYSSCRCAKCKVVESCSKRGCV
ncbi:MAG: two pore domain potassium channel family protein [Ignavibacteria bacterium]|nr:two pore domain potassium channel family protein [Ignavibacteria bacterium]